MNRMEYTVTAAVYYCGNLSPHSKLSIFKQCQRVSLKNEGTVLHNRQGYEDKLPKDHKTLKYLPY